MNRTIPQKASLFGILLYAFSLPVSFVPSEFGLAIAMIGWLAEGIVYKHWQFRWHPLFIPLGAYVAWNIVSAAISARPLHSLWAVADNEWSLFVMLMMFWVVNDEDFLAKIAIAFLITGSADVLFSLYQTLSGFDVYRHQALYWMGGGYRAEGFQGFYLTFAAFAMAVFFLSAGFWTEIKGAARKWFGIVSVLSFFGIIGTFARSIWLSLAVALPTFGFLKGKRTGFIVSGGLILFVALSVAVLPSIRYRVLSIVDISQNQTRLNLWRTSLSMASDFLLTGVGEENFDYYFEKYRVKGYYDTTVHPHNDYLNVLVASGIPGLVAFLGTWVMGIRSGFRSWRKSGNANVRAIALGSVLTLMGFLVGSLFQDYYGTFANCLEWWLIMGFIMTSEKLTAQPSSISS